MRLVEGERKGTTQSGRVVFGRFGFETTAAGQAVDRRVLRTCARANIGPGECLTASSKAFFLRAPAGPFPRVAAARNS